MTLQEIGVVLVVGAAVAFLVWKMTAGTRARRPSKKPDVRAKDLVRKKPREG